MKSMIVAYDKNRAIGKNGHLPWGRDVPTDIRFFRDSTKGNAIIMGKKTFESIKNPLPDRQNIVLSREPEQIEGATVVHSMQEAYDAAEPGKEIYIIGGGQIFTLAMDTADRILATEIDAEFDGADVFFPQIDMTKWRETAREYHNRNDEDKYDFDFVTYERI